MEPLLKKEIRMRKKLECGVPHPTFQINKRKGWRGLATKGRKSVLPLAVCVLLVFHWDAAAGKGPRYVIRYTE